MKKVYIAGKIGGLPIEVFTENFENGKKQVLEMGFNPISPTDLPHEHGRTWEEYMREDLRALLDCDAVYALSNWKVSPGATIEVQLAKSLKIPVIYQKNN